MKLNLLISYSLCLKSSFFCDEHVLGLPQIIKVILFLITFHGSWIVTLSLHLSVQLVFLVLLLVWYSLQFFERGFICFFWTKVCLVIFLFCNLRYSFFLSVRFNLFWKVFKIFQIVFLFHIQIVPSNYVLFFLLPIELLTFKFSYFFDLLAFILESLCSLFINGHNVVHWVFTFGLCMIINSEWPTWFEKWRISFWMKVIWNRFSIKS